MLNYYNTLLNWRFSFNTFFFFLSLTFSKWGWVTIKNYLILVLLCLIALPVLLLSAKSLTTIFTWIGIVSSLIFLWFCVICLGFIRNLFQYIPALVRGAKSVPSYTISSLLPKLPLPKLFFKVNLISFSKIYCKTLYLFFGGLFTTGCTYWFTQLFTKVVVNLHYYFNRNFLILLFFREIAATVTVFFFGTALGKHESKLLQIKFNEGLLLNFVTLRLQQTWLYFTKFRYSWYLPSNRALVLELSTYFRVINRPLLLAKWNVYWLVYILGGEFGWWVTSNNKTFKLSAFFRNRLSLFWVFGWRECRVVRYISKYVVFNKIYYEFLGFRSFTQILLFLLLVELPISGGYIVSSITRFISGLPLNLQFAVVYQKIENLLREHEFFRYLNTGLLLIRPTLLNFTRFQPADHLSAAYLLFLRWLLVALLIIACFILCVMLWVVSLSFFFYKSVFMGFGVVKKKLIRLFFYYN